MKIYHYHPVYKILLFEDVADPSPLEPGVWLIPAHATSVEPPSTDDGEVSVFDGTSWSIIEDKRGVYYNTETQKEIYNYNPLESPENSTKQAPPELGDKQFLSWNNGWVIETKPELTPEEKLANAGLTIEELKGLLGL